MNTSTISTSIELVVIVIIIVFILLIITWMVGRALFERQVVKSGSCPKCGGTSFHRIHRKAFDRIFGMGLVIRRYQCDNQACKWNGLRHSHAHSHHHSQANENLSP